MSQTSTAGAMPRRANSCCTVIAEALESRCLLDGIPTLVKDIDPTLSVNGPQSLVASGGLLYFIADDGKHGKELWRSDGTEAGTFMLKDIFQGIASSSITDLIDLNGTALFSASNGTQRSIWRSDGSIDGTQKVIDSNGGGFVNVNGTAFFIQFTPSTSNFALWRTNGTAAGTTMVHPVVPAPNSLTDVNGTLFFTGTHAGNSGLFKSDGSGPGTVFVFQRPAFGEGFSEFTAVGNKLFFQLDDNGPAGRELWVSDGTTGGTVLVKDIYPGPAPHHSFPRELTDANGTLYFYADDGVHGQEVWKSDGTTSGTVMIKDVDPANSFLGPSEITSSDGMVFFVQQSENFSGAEVWKTDGTAQGTVIIRDINPNVQTPRNLTDVNGTLYFSANNGNDGFELWRSDGTEKGTAMVMDIYPGHPSFSSAPLFLTNVNGSLFFTAFEATHGRELWTVPAENPNPSWLSPGPGAQYVLAGNTLTVSGGSVTFTGDAASTHTALNVVIENDATVVFNTSQHLGELTLRDTARAAMSMDGSRVLMLTAILIDPNATLDMSDNDLLVDYTTGSPLLMLNGLISAARAGGAWTGPGITSSAAKNANPHNTTLGVMEASDFKAIYGPTATFAGETIDDTAVLVKYTYYGDSDFNGVVNFDDYSRTDAGFNLNRTGWLNGDFDGNDVVNFDDYSLIDLAFNTQL